MPYISLWQPVLNAAIAGSATALGGLVVVVLPATPPDATIAFVLAFAAGVMVTVSVLDLYLPVARASLGAFALATAALGAGAAATSLLARLPVPEPDAVIEAIWGGGVRASGAAALKAAGGGGGGGGGIGGGGGGSGSSGSAAAPRSQPASPRGDRAPSGTFRSLDDAACDAERGGAGAGVGVVGGGGAAGGGGGLVGLGAGGGAGGAGGDARARAWRLAFLLWIVMTVHNLPEGLAVGVSSVKSRELGLVLAGAIFLHNVAEGIVIAVPLLAATGDRALALGVTAASGLSEPVGALAGVLLLRGVAGERGAAALEAALNLTLCAVGGVMLHVSRAELLPHAARLGAPATVAQGFAAGALLIGASLWFLPI